MTITLIDQYPLLRMGLVKFLESRFSELSVREYDSVSHFYKYNPEGGAELIILGIGGTGFESGLRALVALKQWCASLAILVYDERMNAVNALRYLEAGALGYLSKSDDLSRLEEAIGEMLKGKRYIAMDVFEAILEEQLEIGNTYTKSIHVLSPSEQRIAGCLAQGMKVSLIALSPGKKISTINTMKSRIFKKLNVENIIELTHKMKV